MKKFIPLKDTKHSEESEEIRFKCDNICDPTEDLRNQAKLDSNSLEFKRSDFEYQTQTKTNLQRQESTHLRDRPFACVECNSTFSQSGSLKGI